MPTCWYRVKLLFLTHKAQNKYHDSYLSCSHSELGKSNTYELLKIVQICFYGAVLKQFYKLHCNNNFLKEHRSKGYEHLTLFIDLGTSPWDTSIQGTPPFTGHQIRSLKNVRIIFVSITLVLNGQLYSGERDSFSGPGNPGLTCIHGTPWRSKSDWPQRGLISLN